MSSSWRVLLHFSKIDSLKSRNYLVWDFLCFWTIRWIEDTLEMCYGFILRLSKIYMSPFLRVRLGSIPEGSLVNQS